jgi:hypothetical protein
MPSAPSLRGFSGGIGPVVENRESIQFLLRSNKTGPVMSILVLFAHNPIVIYTTQLGSGTISETG